MSRQQKVLIAVIAGAMLLAVALACIRAALAQEAGSGWTLETLKEHFEALRRDDQQAIAAALAAAKEAVTKAEISADKRADASNEIRQAMLDQQKQFADARLVNDLKDSTTKRLDRIDATLSEMSGRSAGVGSVASNVSGFIGALAGLVAVAGFLYMLATRKRATR